MLKCFFCREECPKASKDAKAILCDRCTLRLSAPPDIKVTAPKPTVEEKAAKKEEKAKKKAEKLEKMKTAKRGFGRGWHLKKLFEFEGQYFSMGKEISAADAAKIRKQLKKAGK